MLVERILIRKVLTATLKNFGEMSANSFCVVGRCEMLAELVSVLVEPPTLGTCEVVISRGVGT